MSAPDLDGAATPLDAHAAPPQVASGPDVAPVPGAVPAPGGRAACAACGTLAPADARFCEECGAPLPAPPAPEPPAVDPEPRGGTAPADLDDVGPVAPDEVAAPPGAAGDGCAECGALVEDGYCTSCGAKAAVPRDHVVEQPSAWVAAVSDRGVRRRRNEDAAAVAARQEPRDFAALVVCDGVASARNSDVASLAAARAARDALTAVPGPSPATVLTAAERLRSAGETAQRAVIEATPPDAGEGPPSCTFVAVLLEGGVITAGVVGDSRAYWFPDAGPAWVLTTDDSLAAELLAAGRPREEAEAGPFAHTITRWLGVDSPDHTPRLTTLDVAGPGWLLACSDGLWNYASAPEDLADVVRRAAAGAGGEVLATASALVDWANARGGHDNITVALARLDPEPGARPTREG